VKLQSIERAWRTTWMHAIARALPGKRLESTPEWDSRNWRVLFLRYERIGDMIMSTGVIRAIAQSQPTITVDVLANPAALPVLENNPHVNRALALNRGSLRSYEQTLRRVKAGGYDVIVDGRLNNPPIFTSTPLIMLASRARYRIGVSGGNNDRIYNLRAAPYDRNTHYVEGSKELGVPFGIDPGSTDWQPEIFLTGNETSTADAHWTRSAGLVAQGHSGATRRLLVNLSASEPKRRWPDGKFTAVLRSVRASNPRMPIIVMGLPKEWESVRAVAGSVDGLAVPTPRLRDALALVGRSDIVFTPDTSISHAASAFRKPSLVLLKREHRPYAPYNTPGRVLLWNEDEIAELPYERVLAELNSVLAQFAAE
jgi:ADP-heptose:LPS heptosyltransferase